MLIVKDVGTTFRITISSRARLSDSLRRSSGIISHNIDSERLSIQNDSNE